MRPKTRETLVYVLHSSDLYGTERIALATAQGLADEFETIFMGPPGLAMDEFEKLGFQTRRYRTSMDLARVLIPILRENQSLTFVGTGPRYSLVCIALNSLFRRRINQIQIVHGGAGEKQDFARKKFLSVFNLTFITVSNYSRDKLVTYGVPEERIEVIPNFLTDQHLADAPRRAPLTRPPQNAIISSRTADLKRLDVLMDALDLQPALADFPINIFGDGPDLEMLRARGKSANPNICFHGFVADVVDRYAKADLLIHTCPTELFGLVVIEAMAAKIPVLVPDAGGAGDLIEEGITGFKFRANDPRHLAARLTEIRRADPALINRVVENAHQQLCERYSAKASLEKYRQLFAPQGNSR
jgi:glycosyltransferase involved in cell wall biosynthesis